MAGASPMALDRHGQTAAHLACEHRSPACLRALLDSAAGGTMDLEARNYDGEYLPRRKGLSGRTWGPPEAAKPQAQVYLSLPSPSGLTALHVAVNTECHEAVLLLLEHGADIDAVVSALGPGVGPRESGMGGPTGRGLGGRPNGWGGA